MWHPEWFQQFYALVGLSAYMGSPPFQQELTVKLSHAHSAQDFVHARAWQELTSRSAQWFFFGQQHLVWSKILGFSLQTKMWCLLDKSLILAQRVLSVLHDWVKQLQQPSRAWQQEMLILLEWQDSLWQAPADALFQLKWAILPSAFCYDCSGICGHFNRTFKFDEQMTRVASWLNNDHPYALQGVEKCISLPNHNCHSEDEKKTKEHKAFVRTWQSAI